MWYNRQQKNKEADAMAYDKTLVAAKLQRWENYVAGYSLPAWESIPDFGLYMDQVIVILQQYLDFIPAPAEGKDSFVTASTINNYVRLKIMPAPVKKKYGRKHIAYLIMILTLKLSLSISQIGQLLPAAPEEEQVRMLYTYYQEKFSRTRQHFAHTLQQAAQELARSDDADAVAGGMTMEHALSGAFHTLLAGKLMALEGIEWEKTPT